MIAVFMCETAQLRTEEVQRYGDNLNLKAQKDNIQ